MNFCERRAFKSLYKRIIANVSKLCYVFNIKFQARCIWVENNFQAVTLFCHF